MFALQPQIGFSVDLTACFITEEECYHCMASLVAAKDKVFITQTKLLHEVTWKTVMQIAKKYAKNPVLYLQRMCDNQKSERLFIDWCWWILGALPFPHLGEFNTDGFEEKYVDRTISFQFEWWIASSTKASKYYIE